MSDETTVSREPRNFDSDLEKSKTQEDSAYLDKVYKRRFGSILNGHIVEIRRAVHPQEERAGFDKVILFDNGEQITIEEKIRRNTYGHKDFHIELKSVVEKGVPGCQGRRGRQEHAPHNRQGRARGKSTSCHQSS